MTLIQIIGLAAGCSALLAAAVVAGASMIDGAIRAATNQLLEESHRHRLLQSNLAAESYRLSAAQARAGATLIPPPPREATEVLSRATGRR